MPSSGLIASTVIAGLSISGVQTPIQLDAYGNVPVVVGNKITSPVPVTIVNAATGASSTVTAFQGGIWTVGISGVPTVTISGTSATQDTSDFNSAGTTSGPSTAILIGGKTNDGTPQYRPIPLTSGGAAVIVSVGGVGDLPVNLDKWANTSLGTPTAFGTTPGAVVAGSVNASLFSGTVALTSNQTTQHQSLDVNVVSVLGATHSKTNPQFCEISDGTNVMGAMANFGTSPTAVASLNVNASLFIGTTVAVAASAGVQKVGIVGGAGTSLETTAGVLDHNLKNVNNVAVNVGTGAASTGTQRVAVSNDSKVQPWDGTNTVTVKAASTASVAADTSLVVQINPNQPNFTIPLNVASSNVGSSNTSAASWTSATTPGTTVTLVNNVATWSTITVTLNQAPTGSLTAGAVTFQASNDGTNWINVTGMNPANLTLIGPVYTLVAGSYTAFVFNTNLPYFQVKLSTGITGSGTVTVGYAVQSMATMQTTVTSFTGQISSTAGAPASKAVSNSSGSILASNATRKEFLIVNTGTTVVYLAFGQTPTSSAYHVALSACLGSANDGTGGTYTSDMWKGAVNAICAVSGTVCVTELT